MNNLEKRKFTTEDTEFEPIPAGLACGVYFHIPGNYQVLEEFLTARSNKSNK
jgi:hypothetical protein